MPLLKLRAVILRTQRWGDADRIVTMYSRECGKIRGVARGARRMKSRFSGVLEPFGLVDLTLFQKTPEALGHMSHIDLVRTNQGIREDLGAMAAAARMTRMVEWITADRDPNPKMFATLVNGLATLAPHSDVALTTLLFEIHVLGHAGFRPQIDHCTECGRVSDHMSVQWFSPRLGGMVCDECQRRGVGKVLAISRGSVAFIEQARRLPMGRLDRLKAGGQVRLEVEEAIDAYVHTVVGKPLPVVEHWSFSI